MRKPIRYFIMWCGLLGPLFCGAQAISPRLDSIGQKLTNVLSSYFKKYPQEKTFIHTDQSVYLTGQTIWYKAYTLAYGRPSQISKIVYVRLSGPDGKLVIQNKLPLKNSTAYGDINLPDSLHTGWYHLQSFTAWMLNFTDDGVYDQLIYLQNPRDPNLASESPPVAGSYQVNFYPEGGDLIDGNICNVAFKATDDSGRPVKVYGDVLENGKTVKAALITIHDGMGRFELETNAAVNYTAKVHFPDNSVKEIALPKVKKTGIGMRVNTGSTNELEVQITYNGQQPNKNIMLAAMQNNGLNVTYPLQLSRGINIIGVKKDDFSTGILRLTVFDESGLPGAERIVFINKNDQLKFSLSKDTLSMAPKSKNVFTLNFKDHNNKPAPANVSVAITDADLGNGPDDNICSWFLMGSELKGNINQPGWYYKNNSDTLRQQLDLVMLTNGWRHFKWDTILNAKPLALKHAVERSQFIAGKVENYRENDKLKIKLMVIYEDSSKVMDFVEPDSTGVFVLKDYNHPGTASLDFEVVNQKNRKQPAKVSFFNNGIDSISFRTGIPGYMAAVTPDINEALLDSAAKEQNSRFIAKGVTLNTVHVKAQKLTPIETLIRNHVVHLTADNPQTLDLADLPSLPSGSIIEYMVGRIPGLQIIVGGDSAHFTYHGASEISKGFSSEPPYFYIDEASSTLGEVMNMSLNDVAFIQYAPPPVWFAPLGGGNEGAILVYTKKFGEGNNANRTSHGEFDRYTINGYSVTREFSSPEHYQNKHPDYRTTLYWNHDVAADDKGNTKILFYNTDKTKRYRVIVQGITADGKMGFLDEIVAQ